jgi:hypothetical protein
MPPDPNLNDEILDNVIEDETSSPESGETEMSENAQVPGDISADCLELLLDESGAAHTAMMTESRGNAESAHSIVRHSAARKVNEADPHEAAAAEIILKKARP